MTIVAYASAEANPTVSRVDHVIDLSGTGELPTDGLQFYGDAIDSADGGAVWSFAWAILRAPPGPAPEWNGGDDDVQNPILNNVTTWGNYRLFLVATNTNTSETSETDPLLAPASAFVRVRVLSLRKTLEKPAPGEWDWFTAYWELTQVVEDLETATDAQPVLLSAHIPGTQTTLGYRPGVIVKPAYEDTSGDTVEYPYLHVFWCPVAMSFTAWSVVLQDGGDAAPSAEYRFKLAFGAATDMTALSLVTVIAMTVEGAPATDRGVLNLSLALPEGTSLDVPAGGFVAVLCDRCPLESAGDRLGGPMAVTLYGRRT